MRSKSLRPNNVGLHFNSTRSPIKLFRQKTVFSDKTDKELKKMLETDVNRLEKLTNGDGKIFKNGSSERLSSQMKMYKDPPLSPSLIYQHEISSNTAKILGGELRLLTNNLIAENTNLREISETLESLDSTLNIFRAKLMPLKH